jgi:succinylarginine dihydrolase
MYREINFDGLIGPTHNYGGLSLGNLASATNAAQIARPRAAALQGLGKMRACMDLGLAQAILLPHDRPATRLLRALGFDGTDDQVCARAHAADPALLRNAMSASPMWAANAATVSPTPDGSDGRVHFTPANLATNLHRSIEADETARQLALAFADNRRFQVHAALPAPLGDEGAANHMRMTAAHGEPGIEIFVYGERQAGGFPARQHRAASEAVARRHGLSPARTHFARQSDRAIQAGAFHNDVVAVANETVLFAHENAFADAPALHDFVLAHLPGATIITVPGARVSLAEAVASYLFNSQLVTLPQGGMALLLPAEARESAAVWPWLQELVSGNGPIRALHVLDVRESMRNGGGPACLRLRVVVDGAAHAAIDPRFLLDEARWEALHRLVEAHWPEQIAPADLAHRDLWTAARTARSVLFRHLGISDGAQG